MYEIEGGIFASLILFYIFLFNISRFSAAKESMYTKRDIYTYLMRIKSFFFGIYRTKKEIECIYF